jgi:2-dehydro-3-deoxyglucarate aldolase/4-hydroxy-2-oxoheptanedioate aldolase
MSHRGIISSSQPVFASEVHPRRESSVTLDPPPSSLRARVLAGEMLFGTFVLTGSPVVTEMCARAGFDWLVIDLEHGIGTESELLAQINAVGERTAALVRPPSGERLRVGRALDLGAAGIMIPRLDRVDDVAEALSFLRFPPGGVRGIALMTRGLELGRYGHDEVASVNASILGIVQIESGLGVENAAQIAALDGADVLFVGPTDLSHSMGIPGRFGDPAFIEALRTVVRAADGAGKSAGILLRSADDVERHRELGFRFIGIGSDLIFVRDGSRAALEGMRSPA